MIEIDFVSVVKNEELFIDEMINSIFETCPTFLRINKFIIIDDSSTDNTPKIIKKISEKNKKIFFYKNIFKNKVNGTFYGLSKTSSKWVKLVDGDDILDLGKISENDFMCDVFYHDYSTFNNSESKLIRTGPALSDSPLMFFYNLRTIPKGMFFFKKV